MWYTIHALDMQEHIFLVSTNFQWISQWIYISTSIGACAFFFLIMWKSNSIHLLLTRCYCNFSKSSCTRLRHSNNPSFITFVGKNHSKHQLVVKGKKKMTRHDECQRDYNCRKGTILKLYIITFLRMYTTLNVSWLWKEKWKKKEKKDLGYSKSSSFSFTKKKII